ncbi:DNA repair-scaffolding protein-like isoform X3 [Pomacea canaliculata]|nr:DNA repair-scaffolding protein-like isoform X3 [Pomacea canaliculata]
MSKGGDIPYVALFMDVWIVGDRWLADKYSSLCCIDKDNEKVRNRMKILSPDHLQSIRDCEVYLSPLTLAAGVHSLVQISGVIQNIDENSAISWDECDSCGSNQLGTWSSNGTTVCMECKKSVENPVQRMKMDVFVLDENISSLVKISLLQSTIQQILPEEHDEEGYDVNSVLSKHVGPLNCVITSPATKTTSPVARQIF